MKRTLKSLCRGLGQAVVLALFLAATGCQAPVGSLPTQELGAKAAASVSAWTIGTAYTAGMQVTYNGNLYTCLQPNTAQTGWDPVSAPALWTLVGPAPSGTPTATPVTTPVATPTTAPTPTATPVSTSTPVPTSTPSGTVKATGVPGAPTLSQSSWNGAATYTITMNMWWGNNGTTWQLLENGTPVATVNLTDNSPNAQTAAYTATNKANGTYTYTTKLTNSFGTTAGNTLAYTVTQGGPTVPTPTPVTSPTPTATPKPTPTVVPTPTPTPTVNPTPTPTVSPIPGVLAKHALMGYYQDFTNGAAVLKLTDVPATYNMIIVAFANATGVPGQVSFSVDSGLSAAISGGYSDAQFKADIATCEARGQIVIFSVGGQNGTISVSDSTSAATFAASVNSIMSTWGFQGVDIDLENGVNPTYMSQALHAVKSGSIITMAPQTIDVLTTGSDYLALALNIKDILTVMNCQYYNSGSMNGYDGNVYSQGTEDFLTAIATTQLQSGLANGQVGLGLPASPSGAGSGYVSPTVINNACDCLTRGTNPGTYKPPTTYPGMRGVMDWSINWDASSGYAFANAIAPHLATLP